MPNDAKEWDERYRRPGYWAGTEPAEFLRGVLPLLPRGSALDVASGEGRNAVFLAQQGFKVFAVERSLPGLEKTEALARESGVAARWASQFAPAHRHEPPLTLVEADLESASLPAGQFHVVLCFKFLHRPLFPSIVQALRPNGVLVYETYTLAQMQFEGGPKNPEYLLRPGELREAFSAMEILFYSEISAGKGMASLLARRS
jgi:SAM-dependent methyltransferase